MILFERTRPEHARFFVPQAEQWAEWAAIRQMNVFTPQDCRVALSAYQNGRLLGFAGILDVEDVTVAWALFSGDVRRAMPELVRKMRFIIAVQPCAVHMLVDRNHENGHRLARALRMRPTGAAIRGWADRAVDWYCRAANDRD